MFGKRKAPAAQPISSNAAGGSGGGGQSVDDKMPWHGEPSFVACNLAAGNIANNLPLWLTVNGRIHAETYVAAAGAIAGLAAQRSFLERRDDPSIIIQVATTTAGNRYLFDDGMNAMLFAASAADANARPWNVALGAALAAGLPLADAPTLEDMFGYVAGSIGGDNDGLPSVGVSHHPHMPARALLKLLWPRALEFFQADFDEIHRRFGPVPKKWWGAVAAYGCGRPIFDVKDVLAPGIALKIFMETAIYSSKLHPSET